MAFCTQPMQHMFLSSFFRMDHYAVCLSYHSNTELYQQFYLQSFVRLGRHNGQTASERNDALPHRELNQGFTTFWLLTWLLYTVIQLIHLRQTYNLIAGKHNFEIFRWKAELTIVKSNHQLCEVNWYVSVCVNNP